MTNIATVLKSEIARLARKEARAESTPIKKASSTHRTEIAALKRRVHTLEQQLRTALKAVGAAKAAKAAAAAEEAPAAHRFSAKGLGTLRQRLGLSAEDFGLLVGASGQSVYNWEHGSARPRAEYLVRIAELRGLGKREALRRVEQARAD